MVLLSVLVFNVTTDALLLLVEDDVDDTGVITIAVVVVVVVVVFPEEEAKKTFEDECTEGAERIEVALIPPVVLCIKSRRTM